ncbi:MAG: hypothetical protein MI784_09390 [Cytophagales bacterium]|nr:hypothetical protein [Cytophagales bacterium]
MNNNLITKLLWVLFTSFSIFFNSCSESFDPMGSMEESLIVHSDNLSVKKSGYATQSAGGFYYQSGTYSVSSGNTPTLAPIFVNVDLSGALVQYELFTRGGSKIMDLSHGVLDLSYLQSQGISGKLTVLATVTKNGQVTVYERKVEIQLLTSGTTSYSGGDDEDDEEEDKIVILY